jgi:hypothetical protein
MLVRRLHPLEADGARKSGFKRKLRSASILTTKDKVVIAEITIKRKINNQ